MGTRGAYGFLRNGETFVAYNHFDSYPKGLGAALVEDFREVARTLSYEEMAFNVGQIRFVHDEVPPTPEDIERYEKFGDLSVNTGKYDNWYNMLRKAQGKIIPYLTGELDVMGDASSFLAESLWCEWAYIFNFDEKVFEVYRGNCYETPGYGRYANLRDADNEYFGVSLIDVVTFDQLRGKRNIAGYMSTLERRKTLPATKRKLFNIQKEVVPLLEA